MFWDTHDLWLDDPQAQKVKELRRRSNYYESKYDDLASYVESINQLLSTAVDTYGLWKRTFTCLTDNVLEYKYDDAKSEVYEEADKIIKEYETTRNTIARQRDEAYQLYRYYYNSAIREDY